MELLGYLEHSELRGKPMHQRCCDFPVIFGEGGGVQNRFCLLFRPFLFFSIRYCLHFDNFSVVKERLSF